MSVREQLGSLMTLLPTGVRLVAVTKNVDSTLILEAYESGHRDFGENKAQELKEKQPRLPADIRWHFIGHLQTNKVKYIAPFVSLIHSVDSLNLLQEIDRQAERNNRIIPCLLQFYIATEETKFGLELPDAEKLLESYEYSQMQYIRIAGVMGMASLTSVESVQQSEFASLREIFQTLKMKYFADQPYFREISMGMSGDYKIAIQEGTTMIRVGTAIFGEF